MRLVMDLSKSVHAICDLCRPVVRWFDGIADVGRSRGCLAWPCVLVDPGLTIVKLLMPIVGLENAR